MASEVGIVHKLSDSGIPSRYSDLVNNVTSVCCVGTLAESSEMYYQVRMLVELFEMYQLGFNFDFRSLFLIELGQTKYSDVRDAREELVTLEPLEIQLPE